MDPGFVEFVAARSAALFRTAMLIVGDRHAAEDLVQGALERAYRHWDRVAGMEAPEAYVRRILANLATDHHRRHDDSVVATPDPSGSLVSGEVGFAAGQGQRAADLLGVILTTQGPADLEGATVSVSTR